MMTEKQFERFTERLVEIEKAILLVNANLAEHMRRTDQNESQIEKLGETIEPIKDHVRHVEGGLKFMGGLAVAAGIVLGFLKLFVG